MKFYFYVAMFAAAISLFTGAYFVGKSHGKLLVQKQVQDLTIAHQKREDELALKLDIESKKRKVIYKENVKIIDNTKDACANRPAPDDIKRLFND